MADLCKLKENVVIRDAEDQPFVHSLINKRYYPHHVSEESLHRAAQMEVRDDDIWMSSFPKSGNHWLWEVIDMLKRQDATVEPHTGRGATPVEFSWADHDTLTQESSRRTLQCHLTPQDFPRNFETSGAKLIYLYRNPKDVALSYFHHIKNQPRSPYKDGTWNGYINWYTDSDKVIYGGQPSHVREWLGEKEQLKDRMHVLTFEQLKMDHAETVRKLAEFLEIAVSPDLLSAIVKNTTFEHVRDVKAKTLNEKRLFPFRKGDVGDWKNTFTVSQSEAMDRALQISAKGVPFVFSVHMYSNPRLAVP